MYEGIEEAPIDTSMYVDNGDGSATHIETGAVIFNGIEDDAQEMANTTDYEEAKYELVQTYLELVNSTKLSHDYLKRGVHRESNAFMRLLKQTEEGFGNFFMDDEMMGLRSDVRQYEKFMESGWNIFDLSTQHTDLDVLTTLKGGTRAKNHNAILRKFKTLLRVVDLNQNIAQIPQEEFKTKKGK